MEPAQILTALLIGLAWVGYMACLRSYYWAALGLTVAAAGYFASEIRMSSETMTLWAMTGGQPIFDGL